MSSLDFGLLPMLDVVTDLIGEILKKSGLVISTTRVSIEAERTTNIGEHITKIEQERKSRLEGVHLIDELKAQRTKLQLVDLQGAAFSPDGKVLVAFRGPSSATKALFQAIDLRSFAVTESHPVLQVSTGKSATAARFSPDCSLLAVGFEDGNVQLLRTADGSSAFE